MAAAPVPNPQGDPPLAPNIRTYTQEEVDKITAKARSDEKAKLYDDLDKHKKRAQELEDQQKALQAQIDGLKASSTEASQLKGELERLKTEQASAAEKFAKTMDEILDKQKKQFEEHTRKQELISLRRELIASAQGECIPALVAGDTEEAIRASFESSKAEYKRIKDAAEAKAKAEYEEKVKGALPPPVNTGASGSTTDQPSELSEWRKLSPQEWEEKKKAITEKAFKDAGLPMRVSR